MELQSGLKILVLDDMYMWIENSLVHSFVIKVRSSLLHID